jgi:S-adenosylmethionine:tRNA ribosyltransferase-isomerase
MRKSDFFFELPEKLIAQTPIERRDHSRLMLLDKATGAVRHRYFYELPGILTKSDMLVINDSRVLPARLIGARESGAVIELVLLRDMGQNVWECLTRPGRKAREGAKIIFGGGELCGTVREVTAGGNRLIEFEYGGIFLEVLERLGTMPLPPYIHEKLEDPERYQTVYSKNPGSAAAPTAGLHFTDGLLEEVKSAGVEVCSLTLHVGLGTFRPVKAENIEDHEMHSEYFEVTAETAEKIRDHKASGGRVIAVGTTSCRALESLCANFGGLREYSGFTDIFIYPGYEFKCIDGLITNYHLPESTLLMLVSALAGRENVLRAYSEAIEKEYRFFSFGDAMLIR